MVFGAKTGEQLRENVEAVERGPLPQELVDEIERIWEAVRDGIRQR